MFKLRWIKIKLLTFIVPCYNSQDYMHTCLDSLLVGGVDIEIIIVNDGSSDNTKDMADKYMQEHPDIVRVIHQENAGHGGAIMAGLKAATGQYVKVVDSDDWVGQEAYQKVLVCLKSLADQGQSIDLLLANFIYDKVEARHKKVMRYANAIPQDRIIGWDEIKRFRADQYILMHSVIYRTDLVRESEMDLPRYTFYVDNLYVTIPMRHVKKLYYLDVDFYHYFIGRQDQSVNEKVMISRIDQQIFVNKLLINSLDLGTVKNPNLRKILYHYAEVITLASSGLLIVSGTPENLMKKQELWAYIKKFNGNLYKMLRRGIMGRIVNIPGKPGRIVVLILYKVSRVFVGFN